MNGAHTFSERVKPPSYLFTLIPQVHSFHLHLFIHSDTKTRQSTSMRVAVIGAGPSGLTTLKYLTTAHEFFDGLKPIEAQLFESEASIGGTFKHRAYESAEVS